MPDTTRKLMKLLNLTPDEIYHVFCLALCVATVDGRVTDKEGEVLTRIGFGLGLSPEDIAALSENAKEAMKNTSRTDVVAYSLASLKQRLTPEQISGVKQIIRFVAGVDKKLVESEKEFIDMVSEIWAD